ncbi:cell division protein SepF [Apilactobacillus apisilvae]|uniref:Cell division protein SepF n=1 Tax=Apilactobacillus apisilvae TaxID=2923364 RepID=A0ABY4PIG9_9LACO|nr:cell division protein SepF [Apilactobacillus apisilvae]UQS85544.1 cell division protein SepF [Apilactobacillus apisilvae]
MASKFSFSKFFGMDEEEIPQKQDNHSIRDKQKIVSINDNKKSDSKISVFEPRIYSDVKVIAKKLINNYAVIINFDNADDKTTKRIIDFLNGVIFTIDGKIERISELVFLFSPHSYDVDGEFKKNINRRLN